LKIGHFVVELLSFASGIAVIIKAGKATDTSEITKNQREFPVFWTSKLAWTMVVNSGSALDQAVSYET
jgi:hypothetical protein